MTTKPAKFPVCRLPVPKQVHLYVNQMAMCKSAREVTTSYLCHTEENASSDWAKSPKIPFLTLVNESTIGNEEIHWHQHHARTRHILRQRRSYTLLQIIWFDWGAFKYFLSVSSLSCGSPFASEEESAHPIHVLLKSNSQTFHAACLRPNQAESPVVVATDGYLPRVQRICQSSWAGSTCTQFSKDLSRQTELH